LQEKTRNGEDDMNFIFIALMAACSATLVALEVIFG